MPKVPSKTLQQPFNKEKKSSTIIESILFEKHVKVWVLVAVMLLGALGTLLLAGAVRHIYIGGTLLGSYAGLVENVASFPSRMKALVTDHRGLRSRIANADRFQGMSGFTFNYSPGSEPNAGYLLLNRYDGDLGFSVTELWDLNNQRQIHSWNFSKIDDLWSELTLKSARKDIKVDMAANRFGNIHALLDFEGNVYVSQGPLIKTDFCSTLSIVNQDSFYHHSLSMDHEGNLWTPSYIEPKSVDLGPFNFLDDAVAKISKSGTLLMERSIVQILKDNGLGYLVYGTGYSNFDPIHLNDIEPVINDGPFWEKGDIFLSVRNLSLVMLYRPSQNKVLWHKRGPWLHQHDVDVLDDNRISIFNNNVRLKNVFDMQLLGPSNVAIYDFRTDAVTFPLQGAFDTLDIYTETNGLQESHRGGFIIEETIYGRISHFDETESLRWQFVNRDNDGNIYHLAWSRVISNELGESIDKRASQQTCN